MPRTKKKDCVEDLVSRFAQWDPAAAVDEEDLGTLDLFLTVRRDYLGADPYRWDEGDLEQLLLELFPRKVQSDPGLLRDGPAVLGRYLRFLAATDRLKGCGIGQLEAELAEVAPRFAQAMNDPSLFGMAKSLLDGVAFDDLDLTDPGALGQAVERFNALPHEQRAALTDPALAQRLPPEEPLVLPPVTLADERELRRLAAAAPLVLRVGALLSFVGPQGRAVTQTGALRVADATALAEGCGDGERLHRPARWQHAVRRMADLPGVNEAYVLSVQAGLLDVTGSRVRRDLGQPGAGDETDRAAALANAALALGTFLGEPSRYVARLVDVVDESLPGVLGLLYARAEPLPLQKLADDLAGESALVPAFAASTLLSYLDRTFVRLERLGMLTRLGVHVPADRQWLGEQATEATSVALTPLGVWWLQRELPTYGVRTPLVGELAALGARELCAALPGYPLEAGDSELEAWRAARGVEEAARQLAALLGDPDTGVRLVAVTLLEQLPWAAPAVRQLLDDPAARAYARMWLLTHGEQVPERYAHPDDEPLLFVETAGMLLAAGGADDLLEQLAGLDEPVDLVRRLWRIDSPFTEPVLEAVAEGAPKALAKAARKALFSLRSARGR